MVDLSAGLPNPSIRQTVFLSKATPGDDDFALWLAPRLEAAGYEVFADILSLEYGDLWRKEITTTLQSKAVKMLLCCSDETLARRGVQEEISIAEDLAKELKDERFIIPLRIRPFKKLFGIAGMQYLDFSASWANGLRELLDFLERQNIPRRQNPRISPNWESYRKRQAVQIMDEPEVLTSNWLRIRLPATIHYYECTGALDHPALERACNASPIPAYIHNRGFFSFGTADEIEMAFQSAGKFYVRTAESLASFLENGAADPRIPLRDARNIVTAMLRTAWEKHCGSSDLRQYAYSNQTAFYAHEALVGLGKRIPWGPKGERRSSMLCNSAGGKVWQYGVSASPQLWPFPHLRLKARVVFAELAGSKTGEVFGDAGIQHRSRRTICKGWRNKQWHGRLMAFLTILSGKSSEVLVPLSPSVSFTVDPTPMTFRSPVSTAQTNAMLDDDEEMDVSTLGNFDVDEEV